MRLITVGIVTVAVPLQCLPTSFVPHRNHTSAISSVKRLRKNKFIHRVSIMADGRSYLWLSTEQYRHLRLPPNKRGAGRSIPRFRDGRSPAALSGPIR
jgi:hypothetical protein